MVEWSWVMSVITQVMIVLTGLVAIWLTQQDFKPGWVKYAPLFGMVGQPFFMYATYVSEQWGMFVLTFFYTYSWYLGIKNNWFPIWQVWWDLKFTETDEE